VLEDPGPVSFDGLRAEFQPAGPLAANAGFALAISTDVADVSGDRLEQPVTAEVAVAEPIEGGLLDEAHPAAHGRAHGGVGVFEQASRGARPDGGPPPAHIQGGNTLPGSPMGNKTIKIDE